MTCFFLSPSSPIVYQAALFSSHHLLPPLIFNVIISSSKQVDPRVGCHSLYFLLHRVIVGAKLRGKPVSCLCFRRLLRDTAKPKGAFTMKNIGKYILIGLGTIVLEWIFLSVVFELFNGLDQASGVVIGTAFFLAFEMVICTGAVISKIEKAKDESDADSPKNKN